MNSNAPDKAPDLDGQIDLGKIADFLQSVHPTHSKCELVRMLTELAPIEQCTCSLCTQCVFPNCGHMDPGNRGLRLKAPEQVCQALS